MSIRPMTKEERQRSMVRLLSSRSSEDLATAYIELAEENERLRKRLAIWEPQNTAETGRWPIRATEGGA